MTALDRRLVRRKAVWGPKRTVAAALLALFAFAPDASAAKHPHYKVLRPGSANFNARRERLDSDLKFRSEKNQTGSSRIILTLKPGATLPPELQRLATILHGRLGIINGHVITVSNRL